MHLEVATRDSRLLCGLTLVGDGQECIHCWSMRIGSGPLDWDPIPLVAKPQYTPTRLSLNDVVDLDKS